MSEATENASHQPQSGGEAMLYTHIERKE